MGDDITIGVTEIVNNIEVTAQPNDQIVDISVIDNADEVTLNITPTVIEINVNKGSSYARWGTIYGNITDQTDLQNALLLKADLVDGKVPAYQLPSFVDDIIEVANYAALPATGETGKIYVTLDNNKIYRWSGSIYIEIAANNAIWGSITGTLSNQTDLVNALNLRVPYTGATSNVNLGEYGLTSGFLGLDTTPTSTPTGIGTIYWDAANRTAALIDGDGDTTLQIGQEERILVHNNTGATLTDGQVVYITGSTGNLPSVSLANASSETTSAATLGVVTESIANGADGFVTVSGIVNGLNTLAFNEGDLLWLGTTAGTFTTTKPISPNHLVLIGYVIKKAGGNGSILVKIQNTQELEESSDVLFTSLANNQVLTYESATDLWKNKSIATILGYTPANDASVVKLTGDQSITGSKSFTTNTAAPAMVVTNNSTDNGILLQNTSTGRGITSNNVSTGIGIRSDNTSGGTGISSSNTGAGTGIVSTNTSATGSALSISNSSTGYGILLTNSTGTGISSSNTGSGTGFYSNNSSTGNGIQSINSSSGYGISSSNTGSGRGIYSSNNSTGDAINIANSGSGRGIYLTNASTGNSLILNNGTAATGMPFTVSKNSVDKFTINDAGEATGVKFIKSGGTSSQFLKADGSVDSSTYQAALTNPVTGTGTTNYIPKFTGASAIGNSLIFDNGTNVGIGTTSPGAKLDILGNTRTDLSNISLSVSSVSSNPNLSITNKTNGIGGVASIHFGQMTTSGVDSRSGGSIKSISTGTYTAGSGSTYLSDLVFSSTNGIDTERMRITSGGNVGIGITSPSGKLEVSGGYAQFNGGNIDGTLGEAILFGNTSYPTAQKNRIRSSISASANGNLLVLESGNGTTGSYNSNQLVLRGDGNVGIGTASPSFAFGGGLHVKSNSGWGEIRIEGQSSAGGNGSVISFTSEGTALADIYADTDKNLSFRTNGALERMRILANGNVGIGTTSPTQKLQVVGGNGEFVGTSSDVRILLTASGVANTICGFNNSGSTSAIGVPNNSAYLYCAQPYPLVFGTESTERMRITSGGNVGIGITSPLSILHLKVPSATNNYLYQEVTSSNTWSGNLIRYNGTDYMGSIGNVSTGEYRIGGFNNTGYFATFYTNNTERMRITSGGNVGIGVTNPTDGKLQVAGSTQLANTICQTYLGVGAAATKVTSNGSYAIGVDAADGSTERMRITSGGKLLVGTTTAGYGLFGEQRVTINPTNDGIVVAPLTQNFSAYTVQANNDTGTRYALYIANGSGSNVGNISFTSSATSYNTSSDYRLKQDFKPFKGLDLVSKIKVYDYEWKADNSRMNGVIAHELQEVVPYAVTGEKDAEQMQSVDYSKLVPILVQAIQELKQEIEILKNK